MKIEDLSAEAIIREMVSRCYTFDLKRNFVFQIEVEEVAGMDPSRDHDKWIFHASFHLPAPSPGRARGPFHHGWSRSLCDAVRAAAKSALTCDASLPVIVSET